MLPARVSNVVDLLGVSAWYQQLLKGAIILLSAALSRPAAGGG
jgi:ribose/xylose/arabinose/galactoside ABC-type transport system permease subunit